MWHPNYFSSSAGKLLSPIAFFLFMSLITRITSDFFLFNINIVLLFCLAEFSYVCSSCNAFHFGLLFCKFLFSCSLFIPFV
uniref:Putative product n=1 Tax=Xenopsylla cheopis TaxID=163159 RepID=A0A6M2DYT7_XENCH